MNEIFFKSLDNAKNLYQIEKATDGSAGFDLLAAIDTNILISPGLSELIPCGFCLQMPKGIEAQVRPRSGIALKNSVTVLNSPGTIDSDYRGEVAVILINHGKKVYNVERGMRIAQLVFVQLPDIKLIKSNVLDETKRGSGGFGSTGV